MKQLFFILLLCVCCSIDAQNVSKKCKTCGKNIAQCQFKGQHPTKTNTNSSSSSHSRVTSTTNDETLLKKARKCIEENKYNQAESYLDQISNTKMVDYNLLKGDLLYLYKHSANGWRYYYKRAAMLGNEKGKQMSMSFFMTPVLRTTTRNPETEAQKIAAEADSKAPQSWTTGTEETTFSESFKLYLQSAELGYDIAQLNVGRAYLWGYGTSVDSEKAYYWIEKASQQGNSDAKAMLSWFYSNGICTVKDVFKAFDLIKNINYGNASLNQGLCYELGSGVEQNYVKAMECYKNVIKYYDDSYLYDYALERYCYLICIKEIKDTESMTGEFYYKISVGMSKESNSEFVESGCKQKYKSAADTFFDLACSTGVSDDNIMLKIGNKFKDQKKYDQAIEYYNSAAEKKNKYACYNLGDYYEHGYGVTRNFAKAKSWYLKAKEYGHTYVDDDIKRLTRKGF